MESNVAPALVDEGLMSLEEEVEAAIAFWVAQDLPLPLSPLELLLKEGAMMSRSKVTDKAEDKAPHIRNSTSKLNA